MSKHKAPSKTRSPLELAFDVGNYGSLSKLVQPGQEALLRSMQNRIQVDAQVWLLGVISVIFVLAVSYVIIN